MSLIGFDRELRLEWLDAVASRVVLGEQRHDVRKWLNAYLIDQLGGTGSSGNRGKTVTVLTKIWTSPDEYRRELHQRALSAMPSADTSGRLALHWAMALTTYPFFADVAESVGRLLALQGDVDRGAVLLRISEKWGSRPAVSRGCRAIWSSLAWWGVMERGAVRGRYRAREARIEIAPDVSQVIADAMVLCRKTSVGQGVSALSPAVFPFRLQPNAVRWLK